jgi:undecaprenyl pyrophosphate synthase
MKTTIDLPDDLLVAAKKRAAEERTSLRVLFERGLRRELRQPDRPQTRAVRIRWITVRGGLPEGLDLADRAAMHDRLRRTRG